VRQQMAEAAARLAASQHYRGAGTVEFIVNAETFEFFFLEMNTRIQVEHPVTECITGLDLVSLQLRLAAGESLEHLTQDSIPLAGHAIECRLYAENPAKMFLPSPGKLARFALPAATEGVRIDTGVREGDTITAYYDPMVAKLICHGATRDEALARMAAVLDGTTVEGIFTNVEFLRRVVAHAAFQRGEVFTGFIDAYKADLLA